jgi:hypothetical protein
MKVIGLPLEKAASRSWRVRDKAAAYACLKSALSHALKKRKRAAAACWRKYNGMGGKTPCAGGNSRRGAAGGGSVRHHRLTAWRINSENEKREDGVWTAKNEGNSRGERKTGAAS